MAKSSKSFMRLPLSNWHKQNSGYISGERVKDPCLIVYKRPHFLPEQVNSVFPLQKIDKGYDKQVESSIIQIEKVKLNLDLQRRGMPCKRCSYNDQKLIKPRNNTKSKFKIGTYRCDVGLKSLLRSIREFYQNEIISVLSKSHIISDTVLAKKSNLETYVNHIFDKTSRSK